MITNNGKTSFTPHTPLAQAHLSHTLLQLSLIMPNHHLAHTPLALTRARVSIARHGL